MPKSRVKQRQSQKQVVIVNLEGKANRRKRKRRSAPKSKGDQISITPQSLPPNVIYQSSYNVPYPVFKTPATPQERTPFLQDVGQVGTEGRVEILPQPTKKEQQEDLITPIPINRAKDLMAQESEGYSNQLTTFRNTEEINQRLKENFDEIQQNYSSVLGRPIVEATVIPPRKRRNKEEMTEARQMEREDAASINLGLSQFNNPPMPQIQEKMPEPTEKAFKPYSPAKETLTESLIEAKIPSPEKPKRSDSIVSDITVPSDTLSDISPLSNLNPPSIKAKGKGSWEYWLNRYEYMVGTPFDRNKNKIKLPQFKQLVTKMETL